MYNPNVIHAMLCLAVALFSTASVALDVKLDPDRDFIHVQHQGRMIRIERIQDQEHRAEDAWTKTSRKCPPFCAQPMSVAPGVTTVGELEVFDFMEDKVNASAGVIIDARLASFHDAGTIPGSVNIEFKVLQDGKEGPELNRAMAIIGAKRRDDGFFDSTLDSALKGLGLETNKHGQWDFTQVKDVLLWCNGPWCGQSPAAIRGLLELGFPAEKIYYYRGGMQMWQIMGLPVVKPE